MKGLAGKRVLVTGGARGIGLATAKRFVEEGSHVLVADRDPPEDATLAAIRVDIADPDAVDRMVEDAVARLGGFDILVANAGIKHPEPAHTMALENLDRILAVNLRGAFWSMRAALRRFLATGTKGAIVAVTSVHETMTLPDDTAYAMSKAGLAMGMRNLARIHGPDGIRINAVGPGGTFTSMNPTWAPGSPDLVAFERRVPLRRAGDPAEIAAAVAFLASADASYVTGQTLFVDGGLMLGD